MDNQEIVNKTKELGNEFPVEYAYGSKCSLWRTALNKDLVTMEMFLNAKQYYGNLWAYSGD